ncbi:hypothetical protein [Parafrankia sp. EUN1f]|nr:hypothetical protein [Parafrankia sp. EUN1f]
MRRPRAISARTWWGASREEFLFGVDRILDGIAALIDRTHSETGSR